MTWANQKPASGIPARGPGHGGPASGIPAGHDSRGWGWGGPARGAGNGSPRRLARLWQPGQRVGNAPTPASAVRRGRREMLEELLFGIAMNENVSASTCIAATCRLLDLVDGPPKRMQRN